MNEYSNKIEERLICLIKDSEERIFYSDREPLIQNQIISEFYIERKQIEFKEAINQLLYKYQNVTDNQEYGVIYFLFEICQDIKIPQIESTLLDIFKLKTLNGKHYNNKDLDLFILQLLIDLPVTHRTKVELMNLARFSEYKENLGYSLHFLELFSKMNLEIGIILCLNNLIDFHIKGNEIATVFYRLADTLRFVEPSLVEKWYYSILKYPELVNGNLINAALLKFVGFARRKETYFGKPWKSTLDLINCFSHIYSPENNRAFNRATQILTTYSSFHSNFYDDFWLKRDTTEIRESLNNAYKALDVIDDESNFEFISENFGNAIKTFEEPKTMSANN